MTTLLRGSSPTKPFLLPLEGESRPQPVVPPPEHRAVGYWCESPTPPAELADFEIKAKTYCREVIDGPAGHVTWGGVILDRLPEPWASRLLDRPGGRQLLALAAGDHAVLPLAAAG